MAVDAVVSVVAEKLGVLLIEEVKFLRGVKSEVEWIKAELRGIQCFLRDADEKQVLNPYVKNWLADLRDVAYDAEDVVDTLILRNERKKNTKAINRYVSLISCDLIACHKVGNEIGEIRTRLRAISERRSTYDIKNLEAGETSSYAAERLQDRRRPFPHSNVADVIALEDDLKTLKSRLLKDDLNRRAVVSIVGMGGLGKTTLAKKVYTDKEIANHFERRIWITVSQTYSTKGLLEDIWKEVMDISAKNLAVDKMAEKLSICLEEKRYLVVMDDVWDVDAWKIAEAAFPAVSKKGSRVLLTTRNREVALQVQADKKSPLHEPKLLSNRDSLVLFLKKVGIEESECPKNLVELGEKIVKKCRGLPLAIVVLGGLLSSKEVSYSAWSRLLERVSWQLRQDETNCSEILALSFIDLPHYLKPCFIYFGIFPEDYEINIRRLKGLWLAEGLVQRRGQEQLEDVAEDYIEELIGRSMIQVVERRSNGKIKTCRMHDLLRDLALSKANEANFFYIYGNTESTSTNEGSTSTGEATIHRLVAHNIGYEFPSSIDHLRSYLNFNSTFDVINGELVSKFLNNGLQNEGFGLLRVLDLEGVSQPELPEAIGQLVLLRYLGLRWTEVGKTTPSSLPSSLGNLRNLQTLDLKYSGISVSDRPVWELKQLRHLYMSGQYSKLTHPAVSTSSSSFCFKNLQTLSGLYIDGETRIKGGLEKSVHLKKMKLYGDLASQEESLSNWLVKLDKLEALTLVASAGEEIPYRLPTKMRFSKNMHLSKLHLEGRFTEKLLEVKEFPPNLTALTLKSCSLEEDPFPTLEKLPNLRNLLLSISSYRGKKMVCSSGGFQQLQVLMLAGLHELETFEVEEGAMPSLKTLGLLQMRIIPDGLQHITTLQELYLINMWQVRKNTIDEVDRCKIGHIPSIRVLSDAGDISSVKPMDNPMRHYPFNVCRTFQPGDLDKKSSGHSQYSSKGKGPFGNRRRREAEAEVEEKQNQKSVAFGYSILKYFWH